MSSNPEIKVTIEADFKETGISRAQKAINDFASGIKGAGSIIGSEVDRINSKLGNLGTPLKLAVTGAAGALGVLGLASVKAAGRMEQTKKGFTTMLGSAEAAKDMLKDLSDFAASTPFELDGVLEGSKRLLAMGFNAQQVIPVMTAVGDAAAGLGLGAEGINRLTLAIGQMAAKGKVSGEEMRQLAEAGIPAWDMLAAKMGVSIPEAMKLAEKGAINAADGIQSIISGMNSKFGGLMKEQSDTVLGIWSNTQDEIGRLAVATGDEITKAFDLKTKMKGALDFLTEFRNKVEQSGLKAAIIDQVPTGYIVGAIGTIASALYVTLIPALKAAAGAAKAFWASLGPVGLGITAMVGVTSYVMTEYEKSGVDEDRKRAAFESAGLNYDDYKVEGSTPKQGFGDFREAEKKIKPQVDPDNLGLDFGKGIGAAATAAKGAADKIKREIDRVNSDLSSLKDKALEAQVGFDRLRVDNAFADLEGGAAVIGDIWKAAIDEVVRMEDEIKRLTKMQEDAQTLLARAQEAGNAEQIARAQEQASKIAQLKVDAELYAKDRAKQLWEDAEKEELALHTQVAATKADLDKAYREGDMEAYMAALNEKSLAEIVALEEKQAMMQQYFDWEMESRQTMQDFMLESMETLKQGMSSAFANAITGSESFSKSIKNLGKQIVNMFIQWQVSRMMASAFGKMMGAKDAAAQKAQISSMLPMAKELAWNVLVYNPSAGIFASAMQGAASFSSAALGAASGSAEGFGSNKSWNPDTSASGSWTSNTDSSWQDKHKSNVSFLATGGLVTGPTLGLIGEGRYDEAVIPLGGSVFERFFAPLLGERSDGAVTAIQNVYGDINNGSDEESLFISFGEQLSLALRGT